MRPTYVATRRTVTRTPGPCDCKVGRVSEEFGLTGVDEELAARRRGESGPPASLRDLAGYFNKEVVRGALAGTDESPLAGEAENIHRLLADDEVSSGTRIRVRKQLEGLGVDAEAVEAGFVSHPTMGRHLDGCLGAERPDTTGDRLETARERIFKLQSRVEAVTGNTLSGLASAGLVAAGELTVTVDAQVVCETCGVHGDVAGFIERGGCDCRDEG